MKTFKDFLKEAPISQDLSQRVRDTLQEAPVRILEQQNQVHLYHLLTKSYKKHKALDDLYVGLREAQDSIGEAWIQLGGELKVPESQDLNTDVTKIKSYLEFILKENLSTIKGTHDPVLSSINDTFISIQGLVQKALYFFNE